MTDPAPSLRLLLHRLSVQAPLGFASRPLDLELRSGEFGLIIGPGGSGKSLLLEHLAEIRRPGTQLKGRIEFRRTLSPQPESEPLSASPSATASPLVALIPQDARLSALPTDRVWSLIGGAEPAERWLPRVGLSAQRLKSVTMRNLSVGERKRVLLARALSRPFDLVMFDGYGETLDPISRGKVLDLLEEACGQGKIVLMTTRESNPAGVAASFSFRLGDAETEQAVPLLRKTEDRLGPHRHALIEVAGLTVARGRSGFLGRLPQALPVSDATLYLRHGETLVLVGPSGAGKTTLLEAIAGLRPPSRGRVRIAGINVSDARAGQQLGIQRQVQLVFQDALAVLDGQRTVEQHLVEAGRLARTRPTAPIIWLEKLGLPSRLLGVRADVLSASEAARVDLARSLAVGPRAILLDEPRDAAIGSDGGILTSLLSSEKARGTSFLLATSEPDLARQLADRVAVMDSGRIIEWGSPQDVLDEPAHPRSAALFHGPGVAPVLLQRLQRSCAFAGTCSRRQDRCGKEAPALRTLPGDPVGTHRVACFNPLLPKTLDAPAPPGPDPSGHTASD